MDISCYKIRKATLCLFPYIIGIACFFFYFVNPYFQNGSENAQFRIDADSFIYIDLNRAYENVFLLLAINPNTFGPLFLLRITQENFVVIFCINLFLFIQSYKVIVDNYNVKARLFVALIIINPLFIPALTTLNKEIFGIGAMAYYLGFLRNNNTKYFFISILLGLITRWQMVFILIFFHMFKLLIEKFKVGRGKAVFYFILLLSLTFPLLLADFTNVGDLNTLERQQDTAGGAISFFNRLQQNYLYIVAAIPKIFFNLFGNIFRVFGMIVRPSQADFNDIYNNVFMLGYQLVMFFITLFFLFFKKISLRDDLTLLCCIYLIVFSLGPMIQYRYIFPLYIVIITLLSARKPKSIENDERSALELKF